MTAPFLPLEPPWTVEELAATCNASPSFLRKCIKAGTLRVHRLGRVVRIAAPEARRFAADLGAVPIQPAHLCAATDEMERAGLDERRPGVDLQPVRAS